MTQDLNADERSCAAWIARFLKVRGIDRIFGLQGGHIQPIWDHVARQGIRIIDVRDEGAAVHMAHAHAELTGGFGVAMVTAGPGVTNTVTAMANASLARVPVLLIGGCTSRPQANMGPLQDIPHVDLLRPVTRTARTLRVPDQVIRELDEAVARAMGDAGEPGPVYVEIPTDVLRANVPPQLVLDEWMQAKPPRRLPPDPAAVAEAVDVLWNAKRPLVITGRGARQCGAALVRLLDATGALYLDTQESRGLVPADHPATAAAVRAAAMSEADVVLLIGRKLDYQVAYGSPAVFPNARFIRIADNPGELIDNRRGQPELLASPDLALAAMVDAAGNRESALDTAWANGMRERHQQRVTKAANAEKIATGADGKVHPRAIFDAIAAVAEPDYIGIADGGDLLSFARTGLQTTHLHGCRRLRLPWRRRAFRHSGRARHAGAASHLGERRWGFRHQRHGNRHRRSPRRQGGLCRVEQRRLEHRAARSGDELRRPCRRHDAAALRLRRHGTRARLAWRTRRESGRPSWRAGAGLAECAGLVDVVTSQTVVSSDAQKGLGFVPDFQALTAWDDAEQRRRKQD